MCDRTRGLCVLSLLLWLPRMPSPAAAQDAAAAAPPRLPRGFVAVESAGVHSSGWPLEIRCLRDDSVMVFVPAGRTQLGLADEQVGRLLALEESLCPGGHWSRDLPQEAFDDQARQELAAALAKARPGALLTAEDLAAAGDLPVDGQFAVALLAEAQARGLAVPPRELVTWRAAGRSLYALTALPGMWEAIGDETPRGGPRDLIPDARVVDLGPFYIDRHEVTNAQYRRFVESAGDDAPRPEATVRPHPYARPRAYDLWQDDARNDDAQPITLVGPDGAAAYARWAGKAVPTYPQWMRAAVGTGDRLLPWGDAYRAGTCACSVERLPVSGPARSRLGQALEAARLARSLYQEARALRAGVPPRPVGAHPLDVSPFGCLDMGGNVREVVRTEDGPSGYGAAGGDASTAAVTFLLPAHPPAPADRSTNTGFRLVLPVGP